MKGMRPFLLTAFTLFLALQLAQFSLSPASAVAAPTRTPDLAATATRSVAQTAWARKMGLEQYRPADASSIERYSRMTKSQKVRFSAVVGQIILPTQIWVKVDDVYLLILTDVDSLYEATQGNRVTIYGVVNGRLDLKIGGRPANIPNIEHAIFGDSGDWVGLKVLEPTAIPPTPTPTPIAPLTLL